MTLSKDSVFWGFLGAVIMFFSVWFIIAARIKDATTEAIQAGGSYIRVFHMSGLFSALYSCLEVGMKTKTNTD